MAQDTKPVANNPFSKEQLAFASQLIGGTKLDGGVVMAWMAAEEPVGNHQNTDPSGHGPYNFLNIGITDTGSFGESDPVWKTPDGAGAATAAWIHGKTDKRGITAPSYGPAAGSIQGILKSAGSSPGSQIAAISGSGWASSNYAGVLDPLYAQYGRFAPGGSTSAAGGTAGAGGTGTLLNDSSGFTVGDPSNPDEDYWTAINRLAQERYWYVFSDGETLYLADGPDLMRQTPAMRLDRIQDAALINHLDLTFDNTAWQYSVTHHKRRRAQRRTALAKVTSPVEGILDVICKIDEIRAGDVVELSSVGPGDGQWLAGDVRRNVFEVMSEVTLVPPLSPLTEGQLNPAGQNKNNASPFAPAISIKGYVNPVAGWTSSRIDAGVDGTLKGNYLAPGDSVIEVAEDNTPLPPAGWGGGYIAGRFQNGKMKGKCWYVAEGVSTLVHRGQVVAAGTPVARPTATGYVGNGVIETGWADPSNPGNALGFVIGTSDQSPGALACGDSFSRFLASLGEKEIGHRENAGVGVKAAPMPPGYP